MKKTAQIISIVFGILIFSLVLLVAFDLNDILFNRLVTCCLILAAILIIRLNDNLSSIKSETRATQSHKAES
jgi:glycerol-3-phosphate acyltransferase PlsY